MIVEVLDKRNVPLEVLTPRQRITSLEVFQGLFFKLPSLGDVLGPPSSVDGDFVQFNGTSGTVIKDGGLSLDISGALGVSDVKLPSQHAVKTYADAGDAATLVAAEAYADTGDAGRVPLSRLINTTSPLTGGGNLSADRTLAIPQANGSNNGFLSAVDWTRFDSIATLGVPSTRQISTTSPLTGGGDLSANRTLAIPQANGATNGFLSAADWTRFDAATSGGVPSTRQINTTTPLTGGGDLSANRTLAIPQANGSTSGFLSATDWTRFDAAAGVAGVSSWKGRTGVVVPLANDYTEAQLSFSDILANDVSAAMHGFAPKLPNDPTLFFNGAGQYIAIPGSGVGNTQLISGGGVAWTGTGFNYIISAAVYLINGTQYSSPQTAVTLTTADPSQDRIDVFYVNTSGVAGFITGVPGLPPLQPSVDPGSQLMLTFAYVPAASTVPIITNENVYLEDVEYTMSTNFAGQVNLASTNNPYAGTKCIEGTSVAAGTLFTGVKPSGTLTLSNYVQLVFQIRSKASWASQKSISIFWLNGSTVVGSSVALKQGTFGFNSGNTTTYQQIVVPISSFGAASPVDRLRFSVSGGGANIGFYVDNIIIQAGGGGGGGGGTLTNFSAGNLVPLFSTSVANPTSTPALSFALSNAAAHSYFGNNTGGSGPPGFRQIDYSELTGTPVAVSVKRNFTFTQNKTSGVVVGKIPGFWVCPFAGTITGWNITVDTGTITVKVWKIATGTARPTNANSINTSGLSLSTGTSIRSSVTSDFTTLAVAVGDIFACEITAVSGVTEVGGAVEILQT